MEESAKREDTASTKAHMASRFSKKAAVKYDLMCVFF